MALPRDAQTWPDLHEWPGTKRNTDSELCVCVRPDGVGASALRGPGAQLAWPTMTHARGPSQGLSASLLVSTHSGLKDQPFVLCSCLAGDPSLTFLALACPSFWVRLPHSCSSSTQPPVLVIFPLWDPSRQPQLSFFCIPIVPKIHQPCA